MKSRRSRLDSVGSLLSRVDRRRRPPLLQRQGFRRSAQSGGEPGLDVWPEKTCTLAGLIEAPALPCHADPLACLGLAETTGMTQTCEGLAEGGEFGLHTGLYLIG